LQLPLQNFQALVQNMAASVQASAAQLVDLTVGSVLRAVLEASASIALWMQWLILQVLQTTRAATSSGADVDSWMADFGLARLPAVAASGIVTFSRFTAATSALIPVGTLVRTSDGSQTFAVIAATANVAWSASQSGYMMPVGMASLDAPVQALGAGVAGNVQAGAISLLVSTVPGIDTVTNAGAMQGGLDAESDDALRTRFAGFMDSRSRATSQAIGFAIAGIQQGLDWVIQENEDPSGDTVPGRFVVTVNDGTGQPSSALLAEVYAAVDAVRPVTSVFTVQPPVIVSVAVSLAITVATGVDKNSVTGVVGLAIQTFLASLKIGQSLPVSRLAQIAYAAHPSVTNVTQILLNQTASDIVVSPTALVQVTSLAVN
jgi:uncharacterized phage protein gp47/JayE